MVGLGSTTPGGIAVTDASIWNGGYVDASLASRWLDLTTGHGSTLAEIGPEMGAAYTIVPALAAAGYDRLRVVKYAYAGRSLAVDYLPPAGAYLSNLCSAVHAAIVALPPCRQVTVAGLVWWQGEADANNAGWAAAYQANLTALLAYLRGRWPLFGSAGMAASLALITHEPAVRTHCATVNTAISNVAAADGSAATYDCGALLTPGNVHASGAQQWTAGQGLGTALAGLL